MTKAENKIFESASILNTVIEKHKKENKKIVFTNGCFDILHIGHAKYLAEAKELGDILIVAINDDNSVKALKGESRPINKVYDRMLLLAYLESTDYILSFSETTAINTIEILKPHIYVKGGDVVLERVPEKPTVEKYGGKIVLMKESVGYSSTNVINKITNK